MTEKVVVATTLAVLFPLMAILIRVVKSLPCHPPPTNTISSLNASTGHLMVFLGSGGHTGEMLRILESISMEKVKNRTWVVLQGDTSSLHRIKQFDEGIKGGKLRYISVVRARKVGEPMALSVVSTLKSLVLVAVQLITQKLLPDVVMLNGPGTCVPIAYLLFMLKVIGLSRTRIIYIELLARVNSLSVSGWLLRPIANRLLVQWPSLAQKYPGTEYYGILV